MEKCEKCMHMDCECDVEDGNCKGCDTMADGCSCGVDKNHAEQPVAEVPADETVEA